MGIAIVLGEWWLANPNATDSYYQPPTERVAGELAEEGNNSWRLRTVGRLAPHFDRPSLGDRGIGPPRHTIWGTGLDGDAVSPLDCFLMRDPYVAFHVRGGRQDWVTNCFVTGCAFVNAADLVDSVDIEFDDLSEWTVDSATQYIHYRDESSEATISLLKEAIHAEVLGCSVTLTWGIDLSSPDSAFNAPPSAIITITDRVAIGELATKWVYPLQQLFQLLCMRPTRITRVSARLADPNGSGCRVKIVIGQLPPAISLVEQHEGRAAQHRNMLAARCDLARVGIDFATLIRNYWAAYKSDKYQRSLLCLLESQNQLRDTSTEISALNAAVSLEQLHLAGFDSKLLPSNEFKARVRAILDACPGEHKQWLKDVIRNKNSKSFVCRLNELINASQGVGADLRAAWPNLITVANNIRNNIAHGNAFASQSNSHRYSGTEIALRWISRHILLQRLGLTNQAATDIIRKKASFRNDIDNLASWNELIPDGLAND